MTKAECWADPEWKAAHWGDRKGRPWTSAEHDQALTMRFYKKTDAQIAAALDRSEGSVMAKLGYWRTAA